VNRPSDVSPGERTDLAWQRTGLGLLSVSGLLGARALKSGAPALLVVAGLACLLGLGVLTPRRHRLLQRNSGDAAAPRILGAATIAVVLVAVGAGAAVLAVPGR
jgi:putative membrane protein